MKIFMVEFSSSGRDGNDIVVCKQQPEVRIELEHKGYRNPIEILNVKEINDQEIRMSDITVGDFLKLIKYKIGKKTVNEV